MSVFLKKELSKGKRNEFLSRRLFSRKEFPFGIVFLTIYCRHIKNINFYIKIETFAQFCINF